MARVQLTELTAFVAVAEHASFTKAAAQVGIALPTMSQTIRSLEERLGVRLFNRTTRSVALTEAGERLLAEVQPILESVDHAVESVNSFRDKPIGTLRLAVAHTAVQILAARGLPPLIQPFLAEYPSIRLEIAVHNTDGDIVSGRFDAGIRLGHRIERDMTILRLLDEFPMPTGRPRRPIWRSARRRLIRKTCMTTTVSASAPGTARYPSWVFNKGDQQIEVAIQGPLTVNAIDVAFRKALDWVGVAYLPEPIVASHLAEGRLIPVLEDWTRTLPGVFVYHPSRRQTPKPLEVFLRFVETWRKHALAGEAA